MGGDYERERQNSRFAAQVISCRTLNPPHLYLSFSIPTVSEDDGFGSAHSVGLLR